MNIAIIGSGVSAVIVAKTFLEYNYKVYLIDSGNVLEKENIKNIKQSNFIPDIKKSPKYNNKHLANSLIKFKKKYNIRTKNFFLVSSLVTGGLSNFWGAGLEIPNLKYLRKYTFGKSIMKEQKYIDKELKIDKEKFNFFNHFYKQPIIRKMLKKKENSVYFSKFLPAVKQYDEKKLSFEDYSNVDLLSSFNKNIYNSKSQLINLLKNKNFFYIPNTFVSNIRRNKTYRVITDSKKKINIKFNKIVISSGTVGSTLLVDRILNLKERYKLYHTPMLKIIYFSFLLPFILSNKIKFSLPLLNINIQYNREKFFGSLMYLNNISNYFFGISKLNILYSIAKKFVFVGNIFLPSNYSNTTITVKKNKTFIFSNYRLNNDKLLFNLKKKLNSYFSRFNLLDFFPQNFKFLQNGSDAHYTSTLANKNIKGKKILNNYSELVKFKNIHIIDGSSIKEGLYYPTYFLMLYARFISKKIIINDKKKQNKY